MIPEAEIQGMWDAMAPLISVVDIEAAMTTGHVYNAMLENPSLREYLYKSTAAAIGKTGGRKPRARTEKNVWLEGVMRRNHLASGFNGLSWKEHEAAIRCHQEVKIDDGGIMVVVGSTDRDDIVITTSGIKRMLTHILANPL